MIDVVNDRLKRRTRDLRRPLLRHLISLTVASHRVSVFVLLSNRIDRCGTFFGLRLVSLPPIFVHECRVIVHHYHSATSTKLPQHVICHVAWVIGQMTYCGSLDVICHVAWVI